MKIGFDTHYVSNLEFGGGGRFAAELVRSLVALDCENEYILYAAGDHPYYRQFVGNERVRVRLVSSPNGFVRNFISLPRTISQDRPDIVHLHGIMPFFLQSSVVLSVLDLYYLQMQHPKFTEKMIGLLTWWSARRAKHIITISEYSKQDIVNRCSVGSDRIRVIPLGVDRRFVPLDALSVKLKVRQRFGIYGEYILFVGRTEDPRKDLLTLIDAYAILRSNFQKTAQLVIAGRQRSGTAVLLQRIHSLGLDNEVLMAGIVSDADLPALISGAQVFVYTSLFEGFGLPVLEAMACGTPVITSNVTSLPEVVGDAGLMVRPSMVEELVQAMRQVLQSSVLRQQLRERGLRRARLFTWERTAKEVLSVYQEALAEDRQERRSLIR